MVIMAMERWLNKASNAGSSTMPDDWLYPFAMLARADTAALRAPFRLSAGLLKPEHIYAESNQQHGGARK